MPSIKEEIADQATRAVPPVAVSAGAMLYGVTLSQWVAIATLVYILTQIVILIRRELRAVKAQRLVDQRGHRHDAEPKDEHDE